MQITVFAKRRQTKEGKTFFNYLATLTSIYDEEIPCQVKFREGAGQPKPELCPMNIIFDKKDANFTHANIQTLTQQRLGKRMCCGFLNGNRGAIM